jgi:hypothetical protein
VLSGTIQLLLEEQKSKESDMPQLDRAHGVIMSDDSWFD